MRRFLQPSSVGSEPKSWTAHHNGKDYRIPWHPGHTFEQFYSQVSSFQRDNGLPVLSSEQLEDLMCSKLPRGRCTEDSHNRPPAIRQATGGCAACGRR